uniref:UDP-N-acetylglucosamine diphosphorylase 2 n=1 Tax=Zea mays TaxID=4577 RepID=A0A804NV89_MAIZE
MKECRPPAPAVHSRPAPYWICPVSFIEFSKTTFPSPLIVSSMDVFKTFLLFGEVEVTFFQQGTIPCVCHDGRFIMETPYKVAKAPDGNGGVYAGVNYVDCYGVDNVLVRVADPTFLGYFIDRGVSAVAKVVRKAYPQEKVGVFVQRGKGGPLSVVEYSEMDAAMTTEINQTTGRLRYCWSNVCLHMFTLDFLNQVTNSLEKDSIYHLAEKRIPSVHGYTSGLKLE